MKKIHTVLGEINPETLGFTQCHEHIMLSKGQSFLCNEALWLDDVQLSSKEMAEYYKWGGRAIVEAQPGGCNRVTEALPEISEQTNVHIVASTGFHKTQFYQTSHWIHCIGYKALAEFFISELVEGMFKETEFYSSNELEQAVRTHDRQMKSKAGIIKTALDSCGLNNVYKGLFTAASIAQKETGAPLMVHIEKGSDPLELVDFLIQQGLKMEKIYFCHMDRNCSVDTIRAVLSRGVTVEFDTIGRTKYHTDKKEIELIKFVIEQGKIGQLLFSLDTTRARLKAYTPNAVGLTYILKQFIPELKAAGVTEKQIEKIAIENPKQILAW